MATDTPHSEDLQGSGAQHLILRYWNSLIEPAAAIAEPEHRRRARLLALLLVILIPLGALSAISQLLTIPDFTASFAVIVVGVVALIVAYQLNRGGHYIVSAVIASTIPSVASFANVIANPSDIIGFAFITLGVLLGSMLLPVRMTAILAATNCVGVMLLPVFMVELRIDILGPLGFVLISSVLIVVAAYNRNLVEADRHAHLIQVERSLRQSDDRYRAVTELISDYAYSYVVHPDGTWDSEWMTEHSFTRLTGYAIGEINTTFELYHPEDAEVAEQHVKQTLAGKPTQGEYRIVTKGRDVHWLHIRRKPVWSDTEKRVIRYYGVAQDITERMAAETALLESEARFRSLVEQSPLGIVIYSPAGRPILYNRAIVELFHLSEEGLRDLVAHYNVFQDPQLEAQGVMPYLRQAYAGTAVVTPPIRYQLVETHTIAGVQDRERWLISHIYPIKDAEGEVVQIVVIQEDITERRNAEKQQLELVLQQERIQLLEELVSDLSHDIKTPLTSINTVLYLLKRHSDPAKQQEYIGRLEAAATRLSRLVDDILAMARLDKGADLPLEPVRLDGLADHIDTGLWHQIEAKNLTLTVDLSADLPPVFGNAIELSRAFTNVIENAIHYTPGGGTISVRMVADGGHIVLVVQDTGIGISETDLPHIFDRFYRADKGRNSNQGGTGLGLAIVKKIVDLHGGEVVAESTPGKGSTFRIRLPLRDES